MYKKILFPIDTEDKISIKLAFPQVLDIARSFKAEIYVVSVMQDYGTSMVEKYLPKGWMKEIRTEFQDNLKNIVHRYASDVKIECIVEKGSVYNSILDVSRRVEADLIIVTAGRPESKEYLLGRNAAKVVRHADISVLVIRTNQ